MAGDRVTNKISTGVSDGCFVTLGTIFMLYESITAINNTVGRAGLTVARLTATARPAPI